MTKGINRAQLALIAGTALIMITAGLVSTQKAHGVTLEAGGVQMTLDLAETGLQLKFASAG